MGEWEEIKTATGSGKAKGRFILDEQWPGRVGEGETCCSHAVPGAVQSHSVNAMSLPKDF